MKHASHMRALKAGLALATTVSACGDNAGPTGPVIVPDTALLIASAAAVDSLQAGPLNASSSVAFGDLLGVTSIAAVSPLLQAMSHAVTTAWATSTRSALPALPRATMTADLAATAAAKVLPDSVLGKTFEWDTATNHYVITTRSGAPTHGVRFILYALSSDTVAEPVIQVGMLDAIDLTSGSTRKVREVLAGVGGSPTYSDNTFSYTVTEGSTDTTASLTATGFIANGAAGAAYRKLTFTSSLTTQLRDDTGSTQRLALNMNLNQPAVTYGATVTTNVNPGDTTTVYDVSAATTTQSLRALLRTAFNANGGGEIWTDNADELLGAGDIQIAETVVAHLVGGFGPLDYFVYGALGLLGA